MLHITNYTERCRATWRTVTWHVSRTQQIPVPISVPVWGNAIVNLRANVSGMTFAVIASSWCHLPGKQYKRAKVWVITRCKQAMSCSVHWDKTSESKGWDICNYSTQAPVVVTPRWPSNGLHSLHGVMYSLLRICRRRPPLNKLVQSSLCHSSVGLLTNFSPSRP